MTDKKMQFGLAIRGQYTQDQDIRVCFEELIEECVQAEALGFDSITKGSHYSTTPFQAFQQFPLLARLSAETTRVRLNAGIILLSLHKPLDIAEQLATIDIMSNGRVICGVALGYRAVEFAAFGAEIKKRGKLLEGLKRRGAELASDVDRYWHCVAAELEAGQTDDVGNLMPAPDLGERLEAYRDWCRKHPESLADIELTKD